MPTLDFKGKQVVYAHHLSVPYRTLDVAPEKSILPGGGAATEGNLLIHGDNLHALKALMPRYAGRVNCIYIDPPYNTGNEGWAYNDNVNSELMKRWLKENGEVDREDPERHDKWLCMMWPRLQLLRELLAEDGVIFISIDDNEYHHLKIMMDEIFSEYEYRNTLVVSRVKKNIKERERVPTLNSGQNFILFYGKSEDSLIVPPTKFQNKKERWHAFDAPGIRQTMDYELFGVKPPDGRHWMYSKERADNLIKDGRLRANPRTGKPQYLLDESNQTMLDTNWTDLQEYDNKFGFPNGEKNVELIQRIIRMIDNPNAIILDSFAGSGTTAQAVLALNKEDGGKRKFILVECEDYADSITAERVRRVIKGIPDTKNEKLKNGLDGHFAFCTLGEELNIDNLITGKTIPDYDTLARHVTYTATGVTLDKINNGKDYFFAETDDYRLHLIYRPAMSFLRSSESALNLELAERIGGAAQKRGKTALVFAPWKFVSQKDLSRQKVTFCQLPYAIHRLYGD